MKYKFRLKSFHHSSSCKPLTQQK